MARQRDPIAGDDLPLSCELGQDVLEHRRRRAAEDAFARFFARQAFGERVRFVVRLQCREHALRRSEAGTE